MFGIEVMHSKLLAQMLPKMQFVRLKSQPRFLNQREHRKTLIERLLNHANHSTMRSLRKRQRSMNSIVLRISINY